MSKTHLIADESLGGVWREFVEVEREAKDGDFAVFKTEYKGITPGKPYEINVTKPHGGMIEFYDDNGDEHWWDIPSEEFTIVEPTDIVHIDGQRYRLVDRRAKVGEKVIVVEAGGTLVYKNIGEVVEIIETDGNTCGGMIKTYDLGKKGAIYHFQYRVLEPVEPAEENNDETEVSKSVLDLLANLARRVTELEQKLGGYARKIDGIEIDIQNINIDLGAVEETTTELDQKINRLGSANEQAITALARDIETWAQEVERLAGNQSVTLTFDSATIAKIMAKVVAEWR